MTALLIRCTKIFGAAIAGLCLSGAFAPLNAWFLAPVGVALLTLLSQEKSWIFCGSLGFIGGFSYSVTVLHWLSPVGLDTVILLSMLFGAWFLLLFFGLKLTWQLQLAPLWAASIWILMELLSSNIPLGGFGWLRLAFGQSNAPVIPATSIIGVTGVSFLVALTGTLLAKAVSSLFGLQRSTITPTTRGSARWQRIQGGVLFAAVAILLFGGAAIPLLARPSDPNSTPTMTIAAVQGGVPGSGVNSLGRQAQVVQNHVTETKNLAAKVANGQEPQPELVVWPENSTDIDPILNLAIQRSLSKAADAIQAPILVGAVRMNSTTPPTLHNSGILWEPGIGPTHEYVKQFLVPFGEYMPLRNWIAKVTDRVDLVPNDFVPGDKPGVFTVAGNRIGDLICYEILSNTMVRQVAQQDITVLILQANNATYTNSELGGLDEPEQLLNIARIRAIETQKSVVVATTNGITAASDASGQIIEQIPPIRAGSLVAAVPLQYGQSLAVSIGVIVEYLLVTVAIVTLAIGVLVARRSRQPRPASISDGDSN